MTILKFGLTANARTRPIAAGRVTSSGFSVDASLLGASELFLRQLRDAEFDVAEMSISSLTIALAAGNTDWVALPVFTTRYFFHALMLVRDAAGISTPHDLRGKRIGVPEYQQTGAVWTRGVLADEFGVGSGDFQTWMERLPSHSHAGATGTPPPWGDLVHQITADRNMGEMMQSGALDAVMMYFPARIANAIDRSTLDLRVQPGISPLFADQRAEGMRYLRKTRIHHINHCVVVRRTLVERDPGLAAAIYAVFEDARQLAEQDRAEQIDYHFQAGLIDEVARDALGVPLVNYGIEANRPTLDTLLRYAFEQKLTPRAMRTDDVFGAGIVT